MPGDPARATDCRTNVLTKTTGGKTHRQGCRYFIAIDMWNITAAHTSGNADVVEDRDSTRPSKVC